MKNVLKVTFVIIGSIIGAGFISGQEIFLFFNRYGYTGLIGLVLAAILTSLIIYKLFIIINKKQIKNYSEFLLQINPNKKINKIIKNSIKIFLIISFYIMIAGFCAYFKQEFKIPIIFSSAIMAVMCYLTFKNETKGIVTINTALIPFLSIFIFWVGAKNLSFTFELLNNNLEFEWSLGWLLGSILYVGHNTVMITPILIELKEYINTKQKIRRTSLLCGAVLGLLGIAIYFLLLRGDSYVRHLEMPMIQIVREFGEGYSWVYGVVIIIAIFTSAIAVGYSFLKNVSSAHKNYNIIMILLCCLSIPIAHFGFSNLVNILYPIFGALGIMQILLIFKKNKT